MTDILIVDDDEVFAELTMGRLESLWRVAFHKGPFGTINAIRAQQPRLVIMDVNMPGLDGPALSELLRKQPALSHIKVLLMSSLDQRELKALASRFQIDAALHKSASRAELIATIEAFMQPTLS